MKYFARKLGFYVVALWAALTLNFFLPRIMPGDPVDIMVSRLAQKGQVTEATRQAIELLLGADDSVPLWQQYLNYFAQIFRGDLGVSVAYFPTPVATVISETLPWTVGLVGVSTIIAFLLGVTLGTIAGWKRGSWVDNLIPVTTLFQSIPYFWLALILLYVFALQIHAFPLYGGYDVWNVTPGLSWDFVGSVIRYGTLPALTIVISSVGGWMLGMRNMMVTTLSEDYILTAEAKGLSRGRIMRSYAARNAIMPSISGFAISLGFVVAGSVVAESVFSYPGIGFALLTAVQNNDYTLMQGIFLIITISVLGANLLMDLLYGVIDPRTRTQG
ncbi:peptide ABC transporter permease [Bifidobacterium lemurum]|uniref:Peptide ABC transporter permease n=1 Tax=Bifidobacterium lemurum TaxID=1603886 RepID=A0A261FUH4_9BIFI|nr:ABC transporter permease [Bifidobacterium lemurum]OZG62830.1 peptide ABC transporter permease [Bifidobacterium lemurum]QOL35160.1 ABC transporter permease [Bifidobacterium lemurum]